MADINRYITRSNYLSCRHAVEMSLGVRALYILCFRGDTVSERTATQRNIYGKLPLFLVLIRGVCRTQIHDIKEDI